MSKHAVVHFEIGGPDRQALQDFYSKLFGWTIDADNPMDYAVVLKTDDGIGGGITQPPTGEPYCSFYVTCGDDVAGVLAKAESLGATKVMDTMEIPNGGPTIAMFQDPDGNMIGLVNGSPDEAAPMTGGGDPVSWFEVAGRDGAALQNFYGKLFDWKIDADNQMRYGMTDPIGNGVGGGIYGADEPSVTVYVAVPDLDGTLAKASELGGRTLMEPADVPGGPRVALFADPAGNRIGLLKPMQAG